MKTLNECKERLDRVIKWCNNNDDFDTAEAIETYLHCLKTTCVRVTEHILDLDYDYVKENFDSWDEYLMENLGISYKDFKIITDAELADIF